MSRHHAKLPLSELGKQHIRRELRLASRYAETFRRQLVEQYGERCMACGATEGLQLDHIRPVSKGGISDIRNLQLLCQACNEYKADQMIDFRRRCRRN